MITTEAWVLRRGPDEQRSALGTDDFRIEAYSFPDLEDDELLVEPLFGCREGNLSHAIARRPVDVCRQQGEEKVVLGNSAVLRVLKAGAAVRGIREGDVGALWGSGKHDEPMRTGWMPEVTDVHGWEDVERLARDAAAGASGSFFPVYRVSTV